MFEVDRRLHSFIKVQRAADLEVEQRLKAALRQLCLVGCVLGGPGGRAGGRDDCEEERLVSKGRNFFFQ